MTNSEKTYTTSNLSQHKYLRIKNQLEQGAENALPNCGEKGFATRARRLVPLSENYNHTQQNNVFYCQHVYKMESGWKDGELECILDFDSASYQQHKRQLSYHTFAKIAASQGYTSKSDLPKLLINTQLEPRASASRQSATLNNLHDLHSPKSSLSSAEESLSRLMDIATPEHDSCDDKISSLNNQPLIFSEAHKLPIISEKPRRSSANNGHLRAATRDERMTRNAPESSNKMADPFYQKISYLSSEPGTSRVKNRQAMSITKSSGYESKRRDTPYHSQQSTLFKPDPRPCSRWYEMKTPKFHVEARRNNTFIRKICNW